MDDQRDHAEEQLPGDPPMTGARLYHRMVRHYALTDSAYGPEHDQGRLDMLRQMALALWPYLSVASVAEHVADDVNDALAAPGGAR